MSEKKAILVVGAGDATGGAIARRFAREGYIACVTRRHADKLAPLVARIEAEGGSAHAFGSDARKEDEVVALFAQIEKEIAPIEVAVFNIGANVRFPITETTARVYHKVWEMGCFGGFLVGREAARVMLPRGARFDFFHRRDGQPARRQWLRRVRRRQAWRCARWRRAWRANSARKGIHVAQIIVDAAIDTEFIRENFPQRYALKEREGIVDPEAIAESYWQLHRQPRNAWTHEMDLRPWIETW